MNSSHTVESMLKELKHNLTKYESLLQKIEKFDLFKKSSKVLNLNEENLEITMKPDLTDIDEIKQEIGRNVKSVSAVITKQDQKFIFNEYKKLNEQLNERNKIIIKNLNKLNEKKKLQNLMLNKKNLDNAKGVELLNEEHQSLNTCLQISEDMKKIVINSEEELKNQQTTLKNNQFKIETLLNKFPIINKVLGNIKFHKYKEKIILGLVIGAIVFLGLYLTYY